MLDDNLLLKEARYTMHYLFLNALIEQIETYVNRHGAVNEESYDLYILPYLRRERAAYAAAIEGKNPYDIMYMSIREFYD